MDIILDGLANYGAMGMILVYMLWKEASETKYRREEEKQRENGIAERIKANQESQKEYILTIANFSTILDKTNCTMIELTKLLKERRCMLTEGKYE